MMLLENRPRPRRLLATALARAARTELAARLEGEERHALGADLIDVTMEAGSEPYRHELRAGVEALVGRDVAVLLRDGVDRVRWNDLGAFQEANDAVQQALANGVPAGE